MRVKAILVLFGILLFAGCGKEEVNSFTGIADQVADVRDTVVHVLKEGECQGSGCIISSDGYIFTAKHVTDGDAESYVVTLDNGDEYPVVKALEVKDHDVSILKINPKQPLPYCELADVGEMRPGDMLFIMGSPLGKFNVNTVTLGVLSYMERDLDSIVSSYYPHYGWTPVFQSDAAAYPGNSGGPVFNMDGEVVGVLVAGMAPSLNYSVPVAVFMDDIETIRLWFELSRFEVLEPEAYEEFYQGFAEWYLENKEKFSR
jgi:S1-C subfamily serine protease